MFVSISISLQSTVTGESGKSGVVVPSLAEKVSNGNTESATTRPLGELESLAKVLSGKSDFAMTYLVQVKFNEHIDI